MTYEEYCEIMDYSNFMIDSENPYDMKIIKALEKQIPKKPKINHYEDKGEKPYTKVCCPNGCHIQLFPVTEKRLAHEHVYCPKCGQAIDWSDEE